MIEQYMVYIWLGVFILTIIIEACTFELVSVWFSIASVFCIIFSFIPGLPFYGEIIIFVGVSALCLLLLRPVANKALKRKISKSNIDEIIGKKGIIIKETSSLNKGEVKINDTIWTSLPYNENIVIKEGEIVEVVAISGNKLFVKPVSKN